MALKPTIYKLNLNLADSDKHHYQSYQLTLAQHPSETAERMVVRILAFALNADERLAFTKGISTAEEPDLWLKEDHGAIALWIEVGQPKADRLRKAVNQAAEVKLYAFGKTADTWWGIESKDIPQSEKLTIARFPWADIEQLAKNLDRNIRWSISIAGGELYVDTGSAVAHIIVGAF
ncbi:YaeQ family protein [Simiduia aestuariiviva]|uniref:Uncharacterized protein YaeQ n=1 Tax=Simiduia aestuariiviva TaxID=1510459 RepID=A0A839UQJ8_9GAMM|nr:YaeQ family protein [Simiduia aestuariiviva]MBB3168116.1 uncharacterized protein YaeQ [Simiduia aestuariiviva]